MKRKILKILIYSTILTISLTACSGKTKTEDKVNVKEKSAKTSVVKNKDDSKCIVLTGTFSAKENKVIVPKISATVEKLPVRVGDIVNEGDVVATLDSKEINDKINQSKTVMDTWFVAVEQAKIGLKQCEDALMASKASYNLTKANIIAANGSKKDLNDNLKIAENSLKQSQISVGKAKETIKVSNESYEQSKKIYEEAKKAVEDTLVKAPIKGVILNINVKKGEVASNSTPIMTLVNVDKIYSTIEINDDLLKKVKVGDKLESYIVPLSKKKAIGTIVKINKKEDIKKNFNSIELEFENEDGKIKPGMIVDVIYK
ncbi:MULTISPECIES: efflux RND transporter periplasmic adaptor subunit [Clostridium]|uniref:AcrA/AcrE family protein VCA0639, putative n=1 Tax=Clostridium novyi (strain NT) TaxID=386415 RepID=A0PZ32_CLONN|nr:MULTISPECIES: efflux RND transporter periplasmic adaptor subunit [Clostridium]ABK60505.1 AcrA/AcrE family protein VCA0639, putative [Clostridium novyi NT]